MRYIPMKSWRLRYRPVFFVVAFVAYVVVQALTGENGLISGVERYQEWQQKKNQLAALEIQVKDMKKQTEGLRSSHLNLDLIQEHIRSDLGYASPTEQIIEVRPLSPRGANADETDPQP